MKKNQPKNRNKNSDKKEKREFYSGIERHERRGSKLLTPFNAKLGATMSWASWRDNGLHEVLWANLIRGNVTQTESLQLFRQVVARAKNSTTDHMETFITHSVLSVLPDGVFDEILEPVLTDAKARKVLPALLFFDCLPDRHHWARHLEKPAPEVHSEPLMRSLAACLDHQSQEATDVRWFKLIYFAVVCERLHFAMQDQARSLEMLEELRLYPDYGDQRAVRPSIRAGEIMLRGNSENSAIPNEVPLSLKDKIPKPWHEQFWQECLSATPCITPPPRKPEPVKGDAYRDQFLEALRALSEHFIATLANTNVDAKRDSAFGLAMYSITLCLGLIQVHQRAEGRIMLRTIVEAYITLRFLAHQDNPTIWAQFRSYGNGQAKLAFLKNLRADDLPSFVSLDDLEAYASEDLWQEFVDIDLKSWSERNLRSMAEEVGIKDLYDKYYDWSSGFVHGNWASIRDTLFTTCLNPLHRFHRIPFIPRFDMPSTLPDAAKLVNSSLDVIGQLFPPFKLRVKHPSPIDVSESDSIEAATDSRSGEEARRETED